MPSMPTLAGAGPVANLRHAAPEIADVVNRIPYDGASRTSANERANPRLTSDINPLR
jgi:hypothetical protein